MWLFCIIVFFDISHNKSWTYNRDFHPILQWRIVVLAHQPLHQIIIARVGTMIAVCMANVYDPTRQHKGLFSCPDHHVLQHERESGITSDSQRRGLLQWLLCQIYVCTKHNPINVAFIICKLNMHYWGSGSQFGCWWVEVYRGSGRGWHKTEKRERWEWRELRGEWPEIPPGRTPEQHSDWTLRKASDVVFATRFRSTTITSYCTIMNHGKRRWAQGLNGLLTCKLIFTGMKAYIQY